MTRKLFASRPLIGRSLQEPLARQFGALTRQQTGLDMLNFRSSPRSVVDWVDVDEDARAKR